MDLKDKKCSFNLGQMLVLSLEEKISFLGKLTLGWELLEDNSRIRKNYQFKNFKLALDFVNLVAMIAETENHHPHISFGWGHCHIEIWTHTHNDVLENDFILAAKIDDCFKSL
jgi:4a-hydroxytetrahydrobiopterin dehydratase